MPMFGPVVSANNNSIAAGRDVFVGYTFEQVQGLIAAATDPLKALNEQQQATLSVLQNRLGLTEGAIRALFRALDEAEVRPEELESKLLKFADSYKHLEAQTTVTANDAPEVAAIKIKAKSALDHGDFDAADNLLAQALAAKDADNERRQAELDRGQLEAAMLEAGRGEIALIRLRYLDAACHFASAAQRVPPGHDQERLAYLDQEAHAYYKQGYEFGDNKALSTAIDRFRVLLALRLSDKIPLDWAMTQNNLSLALRTLGERELNTVLLEEALQASRQALAVFTRELQPLAWAVTLTNIATALARLGERESGTARLEEAIGAYRAALEECTREQMPIEWATIQNNLGNTLLTLAEREQGTERLKEAAQAYAEALKERTRDRIPLDWATAQMSLGNALLLLGERTSNKGYVLEAISAFRLALEEMTRERASLQWAMTQCNLGNALASLGDQEGDPKRLEEALEAYKEALHEYTRERVPLDWAMTQDNFGTVLRSLGELKRDMNRLEAAIEVHREALKVFEQARASHYANLAKANLKRAQRSMRELAHGGQAARR